MRLRFTAVSTSVVQSLWLGAPLMDRMVYTLFFSSLDDEIENRVLFESIRLDLSIQRALHVDSGAQIRIGVKTLVY